MTAALFGKSTEIGDKMSFLLISPAAKRLTPAYIVAVAKHAQSRNESLVAILLDQPEIRNQMLLREWTRFEAESFVTVQITEWIDALTPLVQTGTTITTQSSLLNQPDLQNARETLWSAYEHFPSFKRHCLNQTFQHLQPVLRRYGITTKKAPIVKDLSSYLVEELALLAYLGGTTLFEHEYGPLPRMGIVSAIIDGRYPGLAHIRATLTPYEQVVTQEFKVA